MFSPNLNLSDLVAEHKGHIAAVLDTQSEIERLKELAFQQKEAAKLDRDTLTQLILQLSNERHPSNNGMLQEANVSALLGAININFTAYNSSNDEVRLAYDKAVNVYNDAMVKLFKAKIAYIESCAVYGSMAGLSVNWQALEKRSK